MVSIYKHDIPVTADQLDGNLHVNNVVYVQWMQDLAVNHANINGCTVEVCKRLGISWIARFHHIDYLTPAVDGDVIAASTWLATARKVSCLRKYRFTRHTDGAVLARAETEWVYIDFETGRPRRIDAEVMEMFTMLGDQPLVS